MKISKKVTSKEEREKLAAKKAENDRLFQVYMIEIWQWKLVDGQVTMTGNYKSQEEIISGFKNYLSGAKKAAK